MMHPLRRDALRSVVALCVALFLAVASPLGILRASAQDQIAEADATIRVVHASPGAPDVDVLLDGQPLLKGVSYGTASDYMTFTPQQHRFQVVPTGQTADAAVVDKTIDAGPGQAYVLAVFGLLNNIGGDVYEVDLSEIEPGHSRVRMINLSPDAGVVDLLETGGDEWFSDVDLGKATDYRDVTPGTYSVDVRGGDDRVLQTVSDVTFAETRAYDVVILGQLADNSLSLVSLETRVSPPCSEVLGIEGTGEDACIRLVHAAPDAPPVDVYLNDTTIAQNLAYGTATEYVAAPSGDDRAVRVAATGTPVEQAIIDSNLHFDPGQAYEILVTGAADNLELTITGTDLRPVPEGQARLRLIHASPDSGSVNLGVKGQEEDLFSGVNFRDATDYVVLDAGDYPLEIRPGGQDMNVALATDAKIDAGTVYDLILIGRPADQSLKLLALTAPAQIRTGLVATPSPVDTGTSAAPTVVPSPVEVVDAAGTPTS
ncbi:MAG: DUF4397 domain-containing protein [Thermomicrobiales bacterium]